MEQNAEGASVAEVATCTVKLSGKVDMCNQALWK